MIGRRSLNSRSSVHRNRSFGLFHKSDISVDFPVQCNLQNKFQFVEPLGSERITRTLQVPTLAQFRFASLPLEPAVLILELPVFHLGNNLSLLGSFELEAALRRNDTRGIIMVRSGAAAGRVGIADIPSYEYDCNLRKGTAYPEPRTRPVTRDGKELGNCRRCTHLIVFSPVMHVF